MLFTSYPADVPFAREPAAARLGDKYFLYYCVLFGETLGIGITSGIF